MVIGREGGAFFNFFRFFFLHQRAALAFVTYNITHGRVTAADNVSTAKNIQRFTLVFCARHDVFFQNAFSHPLRGRRLLNKPRQPLRQLYNIISTAVAHENAYPTRYHIAPNQPSPVHSAHPFSCTREPLTEFSLYNIYLYYINVHHRHCYTHNIYLPTATVLLLFLRV